MARYSEPRLCKRKRNFLKKIIEGYAKHPKSGIKKGTTYKFDGYGYNIIPPKKKTSVKKRMTKKRMTKKKIKK